MKKLPRLLLLPALVSPLLLAACGQQPATVASPVAGSPAVGVPATRPAALGLYTLHIRSVNGQPTSSVTRVGGDLTAQEISGLTFSAAAAATSQDAGGTRYSAAITVTNGSGRDINQPLYVPVAVSGYTQNGTYFRDAQDSSGAASDPSGVTPAQADAATPLVTTNVSPSLFSVPAGMSVQSVSPQAWQAPTLANGASQTVTFGFNIPQGNPTYSFSVVFGVFATPAVNHLVISQVYGAGGNSGATYNADYVELFNPTNGAVSTSGLSLQYGSATNTTTFSNINALPAADIQPGSYYLVRLAGGSTGAALPVTPDATIASGPINLSGTNGKIALVSGTAAVSSMDPAASIDFVGFGTANAAEGTRAPAPSTANAIFRAGNGCQDTNNNAADFTAAPAAPRNSAAPVNLCQ